jgi:hypothetical protein
MFDHEVVERESATEDSPPAASAVGRCPNARFHRALHLLPLSEPLRPFWIVTQRRGLIFQPVKSDRMPDLIAAFASAENAAKFMVSRGETG